jgi:hypothetical protein
MKKYPMSDSPKPPNPNRSNGAQTRYAVARFKRDLALGLIRLPKPRGPKPWRTPPPQRPTARKPGKPLVDDKAGVVPGVAVPPDAPELPM